MINRFFVRTLATLMLATAAANAAAEEYTGSGKAFDTDVHRACEKALEVARRDAASKVQKFVDQVILTSTTDTGELSNSTSAEKVEQRALAHTRLVGEPVKNRQMKGDYIECQVDARFEVDPAAVRAEHAAEAASLEKITATDRLLTQYRMELELNQKNYRQKQAQLASVTRDPRSGKVEVVCDAGHTQQCLDEVRKNLAAKERPGLASAIAVDERWLDVSVTLADNTAAPEPLNNTQQKMNWQGLYRVNAALADLYAQRNAELNEQIRITNASLVPEVPPTPSSYIPDFRQAASRVSLIAVLAWECADCDDDQVVELQPLDANAGGQGIIFRAIFDDWIGISSGWFREEIFYCARTDIAFPGAPETCTVGATASGDMIGVGPYLAWGPLSIEASCMTYASDMRVLGVTLTEPFWRLHVSLNMIPEEYGFTAGLGYSRRTMPDFPGQLLTWNETSDMSLSIGYKF
jgi:hypothetical protein